MPFLRRLIWIVLDGVGAGALPDAEEYGDAGADTLGNLSQVLGGLRLPNLERLGLGKAHPIQGLSEEVKAAGAYGRMMKASPGKDSATGHWEMTGVVVDKPFPLYPQGFPEELIREFERRTGRGVLGNKPASGTEIINELGDLHVKTGKPIIYTSADSVFQIAAHKEVIPLEELYRMAETARGMLRGEHLVSRVIARPFTGRSGAYVRVNAERRDFSLEPPRPTLLDCLRRHGFPVAGAGKVADLFAGRGFLECPHTVDNRDTMARLLDLLDRYPSGLLMVNLVDFDTLYGHRNDPQGFRAALEDFDDFIPRLQERMEEGDGCFITSDHGCDPTYPTTDHNREHAIMLAFGQRMRDDVDLGVRRSYADAGSTAAELMGLRCGLDGTSFAESLAR